MWTKKENPLKMREFYRIYLSIHSASASLVVGYLRISSKPFLQVVSVISCKTSSDTLSKGSKSNSTPKTSPLALASANKTPRSTPCLLGLMNSR